MRLEMTPFEINRWNSDDQAVAILMDAHWNQFFAEPKYTNSKGNRSRAHINWQKGLTLITQAGLHLKARTPLWANRAS